MLPTHLPVSQDWLCSIGFYHKPFAPSHWLFAGDDKACLSTYPEFVDSEGERRWYFGHDGSYTRQAIFPPPRNQGEVLDLLNRLGVSIGDPIYETPDKVAL